MNPLALPGPAFADFHAIFSVVVLVLLYFWRRSREAGPLPKIDVKDPYLFACLNRGPAEVIRVAIIGLFDRGLLKIAKGTTRTAEDVQPDFGQPLIERKLLDHFRGGASLPSAWENKDLLSFASAQYEQRLRAADLLPDQATTKARFLAVVVALAAIFGLGGAKIWLAWSSGRSNIEYLIGMMVVATLIATRIWNPYRTRLGDDYLKSMRSLFAGLRGRASSLRPGGATRDALWLAALFGGTALSATAFPVAEYVWARPLPTGSRGSSCGSGGGCGGGGGGGGCGGCGGCGS